MTRPALRILLLGAAFGIATLLFGWWTVPLLGAIWGAIQGPWLRAARDAGLAALLGWGMLLISTTARGPTGELARRIGAVFHVPGWIMLLASLLFATLVAASAAAMVSAMRPETGRRPGAGHGDG